MALIHRGWDHLKRQRPLAAWACWQQVLRRDPFNRAARQALQALASAPGLPGAALAVYRFRMPSDLRRTRWDGILAKDLGDLDAVADVFGHLFTMDPEDAAAGYNHALSLAWLGYNQAAVEMLDRVVEVSAGRDFEGAAEAWKLAELLRQGGGAEALADDLSHSLTAALDEDGDGDGDGDEAWMRAREESGEWRRFTDPMDPSALRPVSGEARVYEWLDRPMPEAREGLTAGDLPRVMASVIVMRGFLRLSSPIAESLRRAEGLLPRGATDRTSTPLPLTMLDAAAWTVRLPNGLGETDRRRLIAESVFEYYTEVWSRTPRKGLDGATPAEAGASGDAATLAKMEGVLRFREQVDHRSEPGRNLGIHMDFGLLRERIAPALAARRAAGREGEPGSGRAGEGSSSQSDRT